jgi:hypothetical protein
MDFTPRDQPPDPAPSPPVLTLNNEAFLEKIRTTHGWMLQFDHLTNRYFLVAYDGEKFSLYQSEDMLFMETSRYQDFTAAVNSLLETPPRLRGKRLGNAKCAHCDRKLTSREYMGVVIYSDHRGTITCDRRPRVDSAVLHEPVEERDGKSGS